jgi:small subunit ribosomal protein S17
VVVEAESEGGPAEEAAESNEAAAEAAAVVDEATETEVGEPADEEATTADAGADEAAAPAEGPASKPARKAPARKPAKPKAEKKAKSRPAAKRSSERKPIVRTPRPERPRGKQKERRGVVVSSGMDKTIVVRVDSTRPDRTYKKVLRRSRKFHAHDERNEANVGDLVRIVETRPLSKTKSWRLAEILEVAK